MRIFETVTDTIVTQLENRVATHEVLLEMFYMYSITLQTPTRYSDSSHVSRNYNPLTLAMACEIRS